ncbi:MAG TPA: aminoglycoside adenylyltransferase domain-containing protein [Actinomycetes bacterium]
MSEHPDGPRRGRWPTPWQAVNELVGRLRDGVVAALGERLVGLYLSGSLAAGGFDPASSDVDFVAAVTEELPPDLVAAVGGVHAGLATGGLPLSDHLEGSYIPLRALRRYDPDDAHHPTIGADWPYGVRRHGPDGVLNRAILREHGVVVLGPDPATLVDPVGAEELRAAVRAVLREFWAAQDERSAWLRPRAYQAFAVLSMCRALYTLEHGRLASKPVAAAWARQRLDPPWPALVDRALAWRSDPRDDQAALPEALAFVRFAVERAEGP